MNVNYEYYRIFYHVAKYGSITQASHALLSNQPNITRAIKNLEAALGCELFVRTNKGVRLTSEGESLYAHIAPAVEHIQIGQEEIAANTGMNKGVISIGVSDIALRCFLLPILSKYRNKFPDIRIKIFNMTSPQAVEAVKDELVNIAFITTPIKPVEDILQHSLCRVPEVLICGQEIHEKIGNAPLSLSDLMSYPLISLGKHTATYAFYSEIFSKNDLPFAPDIEAATADQILPLIRHNLGIGFVPREFLKNHDEADELFVIPLKEKITPRSICYIAKKSKLLTPPAKELKNMLCES